MSRIDDLIAELCPNGVEFEELGKLLAYEQPTRYLVGSTAYNDSFATPVLTAGQTFVLGRTDEKSGIYPASAATPVIIFDDFTTAFKWVDFPFKAKSSAMKMLTPKDPGRASLRYIYYVMQTIRYQPQDHARQWIGVYSGFQVPVPPLEVQREIVRILDQFTQLEAELEAELEARRRQYEHYRATLLFGNEDDEHAPLYRFAAYSDTRIDASALDSSSFVGVDNLLSDKRGKTEANYLPNTSRLTAYQPGDILIGNIRPYLKKIWMADSSGGCSGDVLAVRITDAAQGQLEPAYLYYLLSSDSFFSYNMQHAKGAKMPRGDKAAILNYPIHVPSLGDQRRIVEVLQKFDALVNDISIGLPAELAARRKQYEYYRDKLLTFEEAAA